MSKLLTKMFKKTGIISAILGVILAASLVIAIVFGFNGNARVEDSKSLTISVSQYPYAVKMDKIEAECEKAFKGLDVSYVLKGTMSGDQSEIVYVFDKNVKDEVLELAETYLETAFTAEEWQGWEFSVEKTGEVVVNVMPEGFVDRAIIAGAVFVVLAFIYVAVRYNVKMGLVAAIAVAVGAALTAGLIALVRIPVTNSVAYAIAVGGLLSAVTTLLSFNKARANKSNEVSDNVAVQEISVLTVILGVSLVLVGILATYTTRWFALSALITTLVAAVIGLVYAPAWYLFAKNCGKGDKKSKSGYVGATSKKVKDEEVTVAVAPVEVAPVKEEVVEEAVVEETTEEAVEEISEEVEEEKTEVTSEEVND